MKKNFLTLISLFGFGAVHGQTLVDHLPLSSYSNQTNIQALKSITLQNGFHIPAPGAGKTVTISIAGFQNLVSTPTAGQNYILTRTFRDTVKLAQLANQRTIGQENQIIQYFDGLGRPSQSVQLMASPSYRDIVQHIEYDGFGRESIKYLPYAKNVAGDGSFKPTAKTDQLAYYATTNTWDAAVVKTASPYAVTVFENSPLNRVQQQGAPGSPWQPSANRNTVVAGSNAGRTVGTDYGTNIANEVRLWTVNSTGIGAAATYYTAGKLYKTVIRDENWINTAAAGATPSKTGTVEEFKDFEDRVVLKRVWETESKALNTYYVYDDFGDLRYVIPPGFPSTATTLTEATTGDFHELVYAYKYDEKRRLAEKKIPGKGWEWLAYNANDQVVLSQDAVQRGLGKWSYTKYDAFGRVVQAGLYSKTFASQSAAQTDVNTVSKYWEDRVGAANYTNQAYPKTGQSLHSVNYYDDYVFTGGNTANLQPLNITKSTKIKGLLTGSMVWKDDRSDSMLSINYYDDYGRVIQSVGRNHLNGTDRVTNEYNFPGQVVKSTQVHTPSTGAVVTIITTNEYDHVGRLVQTKKKVNGQDEMIQSRLAYNEIGQLKTKSLHSENGGSNFMTSIGYAYNERGWQTKASSAQFTSQLNYNVNGTTLLGNAQYNGNIAQQLWGYAATTNSTFTYGYDALNRLKSGVSIGTVMSEVLTYDDMGNIKTLVRDNGTAITYNYNNANKSNRLASLTGGVTGSFTYDLNGNATKDRTGMTLSYNYLNLPKTVTGTGKSIVYTYDASGTKLNRKSTVGGITTEQDYIGGIEYSKASGTNPVIERIATEDGFLLNSSGSYSYYYNLTDHLGNVRVVLKKDGTATAPVATVMQKQDYYPFGKTKSIATSINNKYLYNGKEMQTDLNGGTHTLGGSYVLEGQLDYGARFYDAEIGRWNVIDPKAQLLETSSPYVYALNSPSSFIDKDGELPIYIGGKTNQDSERNSKTYWDAQILATIAGSGIPNPGNTALFIDGNRYLYDSGVKKEVRNATLLAGESEASRVRAGYQEGLRDFKRILSHLERDPKTGKITEKIQIYTHSRGAAFGAGYTEALLDMIKQNPDEFADAVNEIDFVYNMAPHGGANINSPRGVDAYAHHHDRDKLSENGMNGVLGDFSSNEKKEGFFGAHANGSFVKDLKVFLSVWQNNKGDSRKIISDFVNKMKALGIKVTVHQ
ncbi:DUF6443 domain-containing protein [Sphingobacterium siyangense]|uniref:DUF6443 domain-containing protein n=1 Tax=Sphingobacterium siyangense TaxID=459529 RepID=UPI002FDE51A1